MVIPSRMVVHRRLTTNTIIISLVFVVCALFIFLITGCSLSEDNTYESESIAVVNLDEGILVNGQRIYYAEDVIQFPSAMFQYTSLDNARAGLESGRYGAYLIIPAQFSLSIESLNSEPQVAELEYVLNTNYSEETQYKLLYSIQNLSVNLNNSLTYMYLSNVLEAFHTAQDGAVTVMENDLLDKQAINEISALDLVNIIAIPQLEGFQYEVEPMDITPYIEENSELLNAIDEQYTTYIETTETQLSERQEEGVHLTDALNTLVSEVEGIQVNQTEDGASIADLASERVDEELLLTRDEIIGE